MNELMPVVAGFLLTTVLGGVLGFFFQRRAWAHQHRVQTRDRDRERAVMVFEEVSRLLDKRLYRLRLLYWSLAGDTGTRSAKSETRMEGYRQVLFEWNDSINRNLALIQQYFGVELRDRFDNRIGADFVTLGKAVEAMWNGRTDGEPIDDTRLNTLADKVYAYNLDMLQAIQTGTVGITGNR
ncbi:hypothetical protein ACIBHY_29595 [Nonomuraea sp. NPDC050547]|uniref:hypothetical protein n=1 Tax=Nonomuraea sp. NPDC050547 TaxID=3364368 RepID=UPI0037B5BF11